MASALARLRGTQPWIRIVTADESIDDATAARWTVEQATGQFVALVGPGYAPEADAIARLLVRLHNDPGIDAAVLVGKDRVWAVRHRGRMDRVPSVVAEEIRIFGGPPRALAPRGARPGQGSGRGGRAHRVYGGWGE